MSRGAAKKNPAGLAAPHDPGRPHAATLFRINSLPCRSEKVRNGVETEDYRPNGLSLWASSGHTLMPFGYEPKLLRFNGGLFAFQHSLPMTADQLRLMLDAADCDWSCVEPTVFGTLLERALDPVERHRLGAHFTPREYIERLVALNHERAEEEKRGIIRWLRPEFQNPSGSGSAVQQSLEGLQAAGPEQPASAPFPWPKTVADQLKAVRDALGAKPGTWSMEEICAAFTGARREAVRRHVQTLEDLGVLVAYATEGPRRWGLVRE